MFAMGWYRHRTRDVWVLSIKLRQGLIREGKKFCLLEKQKFQQSTNVRLADLKALLMGL